MRLSSVGRGVLVGALLAALLFVLAATPASAAGNATIDALSVDDGEGWAGTTETQTVTVDASDVNTSGVSATVEVDFSALTSTDVGAVASPNATVTNGSVAVVGGPATSGGVVTVELNDTSATTVDFELELDVDLTHSMANATTRDYAVGVSVAGTDRTASDARDVTVRAIRYTVDGDERAPPTADPVLVNETVTATGLDAASDYDLYGFDSDAGNATSVVSGVTRTGQSTAEIDTKNVNGGTLSEGWYIVLDDGGTQIAERQGNAFRVTKEEITVSAATETVDDTGDGARTTLQVDSNRGGTFDARVTAGALDGEELYALFEGESEAAVEKTDDDAVLIRDLNSGASVPMDFESIHPATYTLEVSTETNATDTASVTVEEREVDASFGKTVYETRAGDFVTFDVSFDGIKEGYVVVGGDRIGGGGLSNYFDILYVKGGGTVTVNTRLLGSDAPGEEVYISDGSVTSYAHSPNDPVFDNVTFSDSEGNEVASDLEAFRRHIGVSGPVRPIRGGRYRLLAGASGDIVVRDDGVPDFQRPLARSNLFLKPPEIGNFTTYVAPPGKASATDSPSELRSKLTERSNVTKGDRYVVVFDATGFHGTLSWIGEGANPLEDDGTMHPSTLADLVGVPTGFVLEAAQRDPEQNTEASELALAEAADGEAYFLTEDSDGSGSTDTYYLVIDTRGDGPFDGSLAAGQTYDFEAGFRSAPDQHYYFDRIDHATLAADDSAVDHYPYLDPGAENTTWTRNISIEAPRVAYDRTDVEGRPIVLNRSEATITGHTNVAPGTEMSAQLLPDNRTDRQPIAVQEIDLSENGTFEISHDLSERAAGENVSLELYLRDELFDKRRMVLVNDSSEYPVFEVGETPGEVTVSENESTTVTSRLQNVGTLTDRQQVRLRIDEETVATETLTLEGNETHTAEFELPVGDRSPGTYNYSVVTDDDRSRGTLVVENDTQAGENTGNATGTVTPTPTGNATGTPTPTEAPPGSPDDGAGLFGLPIPIAGRHAVGGAVLVGGVYVLDYLRESPKVIEQGITTVRTLLQQLRN